MPKPHRNRKRLPGDPPRRRSRAPTLVDKITVWTAGAGAIGTYIAYKLVDFAFERLNGLF